MVGDLQVGPIRDLGLLEAAAHRASGRKVRARAYDALIAATAVAKGLPLYTCNPDDFTGIPALDLRAVTNPRGR